MRPLAFVAVLVLLPGCVGLGGPGACAAPADGQSWPDRWETGATLTTKRSGGMVDAWGCNASDRPLWLLRSDGDCGGSWTWEGVGGSGPGGHYGESACRDDHWLRLDPGEGVHERFEVTGAPGDTFRVRLHVFLQREMIEDAGGGDLRADIIV